MAYGGLLILMQHLGLSIFSWFITNNSHRESHNSTPFFTMDDLNVIQGSRFKTITGYRIKQKTQVRKRLWMMLEPINPRFYQTILRDKLLMPFDW